MYKMKRCKICNKIVNVHKIHSRYVVRNGCEHMEKIDGKPITDRELREYAKGGF